MVPRHLRHVVAERMDALGTVLKPLDDGRGARGRPVAQGAGGREAIAICFLHSYRNDCA